MENMEMPLKSLYLMRHAKSSWYSDAPDDFSRPLNKRGLQDARKMGRVFQEREWRPQRILYSAAKRTTLTAQLLGSPFSNADEVQSVESMYLARFGSLLELIQQTPEAVAELLLIGHNPGMEELLTWLCEDVEYQANGKLLTTANVVHIAISGKWRELGRHEGRLLAHIRPKTVGN